MPLLRPISAYHPTFDWGHNSNDHRPECVDLLDDLIGPARVAAHLGAPFALQDVNGVQRVDGQPPSRQRDEGYPGARYADGYPYRGQY